MNTEHWPADDLKLQIDSLSNRFEVELREHRNPNPREYLLQIDEGGRDSLLEELLAVQFEIDRAQGRSSDLPGIYAQFPAKSDVILKALLRSAPPAPGNHPLADTTSVRGPEKPLSGEELLSSRYEIGPEVARGAMGVVYRATHRRLDMPAAVKMLLPDASSERFLLEARLAASVNSPHVVRVFDFDVLSDKQPFICMEWIEGSDLAQEIKSAGSVGIPESQAIAWMRQVAQGMADAANQGITHRDVKPSNIMIDEKGNARVADFGLARHSAQTLASSHSTDLMGTPYYMAPEQAEDPHGADTRSDIYSYGATFYHALTGQVPFEGPTLFSVLFKHKTEPLVAPQSLRADLSDSVCQILERCLAKSPNERFQTFRELQRHLDRLTDIPLHWDDQEDDSIVSELQDYLSKRPSFLKGVFEPSEYRFRDNRCLRLVSGNLIEQSVDAIVSSDDSMLTMGGGVSSAIAQAAGREFVDEARAFVPVRAGRVIATRSHGLPARFVLHAVTIGFAPGQLQLPSRDIIAELINSCFYHADSLGLRTVAFPLLGTGAAGFKKDVCLDLMFRLIAKKLCHGLTGVETATIVLMERRRAIFEWYSRISPAANAETVAEAMDRIKQEENQEEASEPAADDTEHVHGLSTLALGKAHFIHELALTDSPQGSATFKLEERQVEVGSDSQCSIHLLGLAPQQFQLARDGQIYRLQVLADNPEIQINGRPVVEPVLLQDQDQIVVGHFSFMYRRFGSNPR